MAAASSEEINEFFSDALPACIESCAQLSSAACALILLGQREDTLIQAATAPDVLNINPDLGIHIQQGNMQTAPDDVKAKMSEKLRAALSQGIQDIKQTQASVQDRANVTSRACVDGPLKMRALKNGKTHTLTVCTSPNRDIHDDGSEHVRHAIDLK